jgi:CheY-like chemotaxis protein
MPEMGGRELAARVRRRFPGIPVLFMSGYDEEAGIGNEPIIEKPFSPSALERRVREVIDGPKSGQSGRA